MNSESNNQVVTAYEVCGMTPEQIAEDLGYELTAVKATLLSCSRLYKRAVGGKEEGKSELFTEEDIVLATQTIKSLARDSEVDSVRLKAATFIIDERQGRNDVQKLSNAGGFNITVFNAQMERARTAMKRVLPNIVDVG